MKTRHLALCLLVAALSLLTACRLFGGGSTSAEASSSEVESAASTDMLTPVIEIPAESGSSDTENEESSGTLQEDSSAQKPDQNEKSTQNPSRKPEKKKPSKPNSEQKSEPADTEPSDSQSSQPDESSKSGDIVLPIVP